MMMLSFLAYSLPSFTSLVNPSGVTPGSGTNNSGASDGFFRGSSCTPFLMRYAANLFPSIITSVVGVRTMVLPPWLTATLS
jgi:hypothetical protein